jgi:hypothetical protein
MFLSLSFLLILAPSLFSKHEEASILFKTQCQHEEIRSVNITDTIRPSNSYCLLNSLSSSDSLPHKKSCSSDYHS